MPNAAGNRDGSPMAEATFSKVSTAGEKERKGVRRNNAGSGALGISS